MNLPSPQTASSIPQVNRFNSSAMEKGKSPRLSTLWGTQLSMITMQMENSYPLPIKRGSSLSSPIWQIQRTTWRKGLIPWVEWQSAPSTTSKAGWSRLPTP